MNVLLWLEAMDPPRGTDGPADASQGAGRRPLGGLDHEGSSTCLAWGSAPHPRTRLPESPSQEPTMATITANVY